MDDKRVIGEIAQILAGFNYAYNADQGDEVYVISILDILLRNGFVFLEKGTVGIPEDEE